VICSYCNACKDLDLLRDASITESEEKRWQCFQCRSSLNKIEIENRLIKEAERLSLSFILQDFRCPKTKRVSTHVCSSKSNTSSDLSMDFPIDSFMNKFTVFMKIAKFHKFELLRSLLIDILGYDEEEK
jgi:DNA polymerase epsilon subunit 1